LDTIVDPDIVYRYREISVNSLTEISTKSFYASKPEMFNDPFDCDFEWIKNDEQECLKHLDYLDKKSSDENVTSMQTANLALQNEITEVVSNLGVTCFTTNPLSPLMWAHYSSSHKGICIGYKREGVLRNPKVFQKVKYDRPNKIRLNSISFFREGFTNIPAEIEKVIFSKLPEWEYEEEWRFYTTNPQDRVQYMKSPIESVTFGYKCSSSERLKVLNILKLQVVSGLTTFYKVVLDSEGYFEREKIDVTTPSVT